MMAIPAGFILRSIERLLEGQYERAISVVSQEIAEVSQYLSLETSRLKIEGRNVRRVAVLNEQEHLLVDFPIDLESVKEIFIDVRDEDNGDAAVSLKQRSDALRSHLTSDVALVSFSSNEVPSLLGLKEGTDFQSHLNLIDIFSLSCNNCLRMKVPSRKLLEKIGATLPGINTYRESNKAADRAAMCLRLFKHYLKIKNDNQAWEAMIQRLLKGEASVGMEVTPVTDGRVEENPSSIFNVNEDVHAKLNVPLEDQGTAGEPGALSRKQYSDRPLLSIDAEFVRIAGNELSVGQAALVNEQGKTLFKAYIRQDEPVINYKTAVNGLTKEILDTEGISFHMAQAMLKRRLPTNAVLVGLGIHQDIMKLMLKEGIDFHSSVDLGDIFRFLVCPICHQNSQPSLDQMSAALLGTKLDGRPHDAADDARRSIEVYKRYLSVKDDPEALKQLKQKIAETPKPRRPKG